MTYVRLLTIAGSDSSGGAGIQADLKTFSALGGYGMSAITALTAQNTQGVAGIHAVPPEFVGQQIDAVMTDIGADAVKIGMLATPGIIRVVADRMRRHAVTRLVLDPVMVATSGDQLLQDDAMEALRSDLIPLATVITPNLSEAGILLGRAIDSDSALEQAAHDLLSLGCRAVLVKGGHGAGLRSDDVLAAHTSSGVNVIRLPGARIETPNTHGTGCTLSSAITAFLGQGRPVVESVRAAKHFIQQAIAAGAAYTLGHGHGPVHHFHAWWGRT